VNRLLLASLTLLCAAMALPLAGCKDKPKETKETPAKPLTNSIGMKLVLIPDGEFLMGSSKDEREAVVSASGFGDTYRRDVEAEGPRHKVKISRPFHLGVYTVTQAQYKKVMGSNPSKFSATGESQDEVKGLDTSDFPVENVSWNDARKFCDKLSALAEEKKAGRKYRLPSEAEWEYACRAGTSTPFHQGKSLSSTQANFNGNSPYGGAKSGPYLGRTSKVGSYRPNAWGLYDMHGNVYQWCADWFGKDYYKDSPRVDPKGSDEDTGRVVRGGSWDNTGSECRAAWRLMSDPTSRYDTYGFRVVCDIPKKP
jgi:formylglycine-generating enzyme required for sulfatase activity